MPAPQQGTENEAGAHGSPAPVAPDATGDAGSGATVSDEPHAPQQVVSLAAVAAAEVAKFKVSNFEVLRAIR